MYGDQGLYLNSYEVDKNGFVDLPTIGKVFVEGMTVDQVQHTIKQKAEEYSEGIVVICRMVTFRIKVAGEVNRPGVYTFYQPSVNIFDALLAAGDLTYYGNRQNSKKNFRRGYSLYFGHKKGFGSAKQKLLFASGRYSVCRAKQKYKNTHNHQPSFDYRYLFSFSYNLHYSNNSYNQQFKQLK